MAELLNEQEQVDAIKQWWKQYGTWLMTLVIIILLVLLGYRFWQNHQQKVSLAASMSYEQLMVDAQQNKWVDVQAQANQLMQEYPHSIYTSLGAFVLVQDQLQQNQLSQAATTLQWVIDHSQDASVVVIAKIRLSRIFLAEGQAQAGLDALKGIEHNPMADMTRGDCYAALKQYAQAKQTYEATLLALMPSDPLYALVQMKLANLPQI
jgi:predicted negative regulator of RcsB-dependent stress response